MNLLAGVHAPSAGEIRIDGAAVRFASPAEARAAGVGAVYQELAVLPELTVAENIWLGREPRTRAGCSTGGRCMPTDGLLDEFACRSTRRRRRHAERRRAPAGRDRPRAVVLGAHPHARRADRGAFGRGARAPVRHRRRAEAAGLLVLFVSHRLDEVFEIADRVTVLRNGRRVFAAPTAA